MKPSHANRPTISSSTRPTNRPTVRPTIHSTRAGYWAHFAVSLLSCWLVSSSVLMMLDPLFRFRLPAGVLLLVAAEGPVDPGAGPQGEQHRRQHQDHVRIVEEHCGFPSMKRFGFCP